jgi:predicted nucleotidyltransferase
MINDEITAIKDSILKTVGEDCEKIILFGSYAYGLPGEGSDAVDVLANYKSRFELRSKLPTIERIIAQKGIVLYDRA